MRIPFILFLICLVFLSCKDRNDTFTDIRDGKTYKTVKMPDGKIWMTENLNYETKYSECYDQIPELCQQCGRLYSWFEAIEICPEGWHLPSYAEWEALAEAVAKDESFDEDFASIPCGFLIFDCMPTFVGFDDITSFWSSTEDKDCNVSPYLGPGSCLAFIWDLSGRTRSEKSNGHNVRCVKD